MEKLTFFSLVLPIALACPALGRDDLNCNLSEYASQLRVSDRAPEISRNIARAHSDLESSLVATMQIDGLADESKAEACYLLGVLRSMEATTQIAVEIDLMVVEKKDINRLPRWTSHPCREALVNIGKPAITAMIELIRTNSSSSARDLAALTVFQIEGVDAGRSRLAKALGEARGIERDRLREATTSSEAEIRARIMVAIQERLRPSVDK